MPLPDKLWLSAEKLEPDVNCCCCLSLERVCPACCAAVAAADPRSPRLRCLAPFACLYSHWSFLTAVAQGVFLLENGYEAFIWVGKAVPPATATALFGE